jgi:hypothetical protein
MKEELIQKFREQSMITRDTEWGENVQFFDYRIFAKLIVEECKKAIDPTDDLCSMMEEVNRYYCVLMIDKHFGVE